MSDIKSGLPIRSEADGLDERLHVKIVDGTNPAVNQMAVDSDKNAHVEMHGNDPAGIDRVQRLSEQGAVTPDGVYNATTNTKPGNVGIIAHTRSASPGDATQNKRVSSVTGANNREALDVAVTDENGAPFTVDNPLPVTFVDSEGSEINNHLASTAVAKDASVNHDYTVTAAMRLKLSQIWATASGKMKIQIAIETGVATNVFNNVYVGFNSTSNPNILVPINENITVAAGVRVRVIRTNLDNAAQDLYSTISGHEMT